MQTVCDMTVYLINNPLSHAISAAFSVILSIPQILCYIVLIKQPHLFIPLRIGATFELIS